MCVRTFACVGVRGERGHIQSLDNSSSFTASRILSCWAQSGCRSVRWEVRRWSIDGGAGWEVRRWGNCINNASPLATAVGALFLLLFTHISSGYATGKKMYSKQGHSTASEFRWEVLLCVKKGLKCDLKCSVFVHDGGNKLHAWSEPWRL